MPIIKKQKGIGLFELLLSLLIISAILFMSVRYYHTVRQSTKVDQALLLIRRLSEASYQWVQTAYDFASPTPISIEALVNAKLISEDVLNSRTNPWGGAISVSPGSEPNFLTIVLEGVPHSACLNVSQKLSGQAVSTICSGDQKLTVLLG